MIRDERGYICTGRDVMDLVAKQQGAWPLERDPYLLETSVPGIFAVGDVRHGSIKRVASGVGEGSMAIAFIHQFLGELDAQHERRRPACGKKIASSRTDLASDDVRQGSVARPSKRRGQAPEEHPA